MNADLHELSTRFLAMVPYRLLAAFDRRSDAGRNAVSRERAAYEEFMASKGLPLMTPPGVTVHQLKDFSYYRLGRYIVQHGSKGVSVWEVSE